jgi:3-oxoacyl-[acyl-carrier-protein] synthase II
MRKRVVVTGLGVITPLGHTVEELFQSQLEGRSGVSEIGLFNASRFPTKFAAQVKNLRLEDHIKGAERWKNSGVNTRFALVAAKQALDHAGLLDDDKVDRTRFGIYLGSGEGIQDFHHLITLIAHSLQEGTLKIHEAEFIQGGLKEFSAEREYEQELHTTTGHVAGYFQLEGPNFNCLTACAASSQAIGEATEIIRHGDADIMLAGGSHSMIHPLGITGFNLLTALSTNNEAPARASRPFDLQRDGFVLGEGAAMLILEELEHAKKRGATIYGEITGYGSSADAFRLTDSHPDGRGAIACIQGAIDDSGLAPEQIGYINAHGTCTQVNDRVETVAIKKVFGEQAYKIPVSSTKSMLGHLIAAAGAVELIISLMAIRAGVLPPTINYENPDPECDLDYIPNTARELKVDHILSNSFGFGGQNITLIASRFKD